MQYSPSALQSMRDNADLIHSASAVQAAIAHIAAQINQDFQQANPIVLSVMDGAVVFAGQLLPQLNFALTFDYVQANRYHNQTQGQAVVWKVLPPDTVKNRKILILDDILDEGITLAAVKQKCLEMGARSVKIAVLVEKTLDKSLNTPKPITADYVGLSVPDRYVFGCGMDAYGYWRNLPAIYALAEDAAG